MIVDGKAIRTRIERDLKQAIAGLPFPLGLSITSVGSDPASQTFLRQKRLAAERVGIHVFVHELPSEDGEGPLGKVLERDAKDPAIHAMILQLPLPKDWKVDPMIARIPDGKDVDVLTRNAFVAFKDEKFPVLPPVVGAIQAILETHGVDIEGKDVLILGRGKLVGQPASIWFRQNGAHVTMAGEEVRDLSTLTKEADIIVSGVGRARLITQGMVKEGVVLLDAGTSEHGGSLVGDVDPSCASVASLMTPVPGGIGPVTVAMVMKNVYMLGRGKNT